jgi:hypothetical protein
MMARRNDDNDEKTTKTNRAPVQKRGSAVVQTQARACVCVVLSSSSFSRVMIDVKSV